MDTNDILSVDQVAQVLSVTPRTVRNLIKRGRFPNAKKMDPLAQKSSFQIPKSDLDEYIELQQGNDSS